MARVPLNPSEIANLDNGVHFAVLSVAPNVYIRLTRKLAHALNGLDLRPFTVGDVIDLHDSLARMLIAERWAEVAVADIPPTADERTPRRRTARKPAIN